GGYVDSGSMVDTWATVGSCAQIGKNVHLSGGVGIGGVLEPPNAIPVVVVESGEEISRAHIPAWSVAVGGTRTKQFAGGSFGLPCVLVLKRLDEGQRHDKAQLNSILRDHGMSA